MIYYTIDNPTNKPVQEWDIPLQSVVYVALKPDAFPNLCLKVLDLDDSQWTGDGQLVQPNSSQNYIVVQSGTASTTYGLYSENNLVLAKMYLGNVPFSRTVSAKVRGYIKTVDGVMTTTIHRWSYTKDENTYTIDLMNLEDYTWGIWNTGVFALPVFAIIRDSQGNILDYCTYHWSRNRTVKIGTKIINVQDYVPFVDSGFIINHPEIVPNRFTFKTRNTFVPYDMTDVGSVEITDCPNITYTLADLITVPITINSQEKSYCYIQF